MEDDSMNEKQPSILKIVWVDTWALFAAIFTLVAPGIYIYNMFFAEQPTDNLGCIMLGILVLSLLGLTIRVISVLSLCNAGLEAKATITEIGFFRDRGYIKFLYTYQGQKFVGSQTVMKNKITTQYRNGQEVNIVVDRENAKKAIITDLFM